MKLSLILVGKTDVKWVMEGLALYSARLTHYVPFEIKEIPQLKNVAALSREQIKQKEGELILKLLRPEDNLILLDERGKQYTSVEWAEKLQGIMNSGRSTVFAIGGAYGFSEDVYRRAGSMLSLSKMTFSHQMVRAIFAEQLYRAFTILNGEPYHHE